MKKIFIILLLLGFSQSYADIYRCVDERGKTVFKDRKCKAADDEGNEVAENQVEIDGDAHTLGGTGRNLLQNGSFRDELTSWEVPDEVEGVSDGSADGNGALIIYASQSTDGQSNRETVVGQCVQIGNGDKFELSAQFKTESTPIMITANRVRLSWFQSADCSTGEQRSSFLDPKSKTGWQTITRKDIPPSLNAKSAKVTIVQIKPYSRGKNAYWDNISLAATDILDVDVEDIESDITLQINMRPGKNTIKNSGFDSSARLWDSYSKIGWTKSEGDTSPGVGIVRLNRSRQTKNFSQCVNFARNTLFEAGASFKKDEGSTANGKGRFQITWYQKYNCQGQMARGEDSEFQDGPGWQRQQFGSLQSPENTLSVRLKVIQSATGKGYFTAYWDDIYLKYIESSD